MIISTLPIILFIIKNVYESAQERQTPLQAVGQKALDVESRMAFRAILPTEDAS